MKPKLLLNCIITISVLFFSQKKAIAQGGKLPLDSTVSGEVSGTNIDYWKVTIPKDGAITTTLTSTNGTVINYPLFDKNYKQVGGNGGTDGLAAGVYYVGVTSYYGNQTVDYTLSAHFTPAPVPNDAEPNNTKEQALIFPLNSSKTGHIGYYSATFDDGADWYKIRTNDGQLNLTMIPNVGHYINIVLYDSATLFETDGNTYIYGNYFADTVNLSFDGLAAGAYYVKLDLFYNQADYSPYTLINNLETYKYAADAEPNDAPYQAQTILPNQTVTGHNGFYYTYNSSDGADWWKINYTGTGNLKLNFNEERRIGDNSFSATEFRVYSDTTKDPIYFATFADSANVANLEGLTPGMYWILVSPSVNYRSFASYSITDSYTTLPVTFINFDGVLNNGEVFLKWSTATELNNKGFEVQKSFDGATFTDIGFVKGAGNLSQINNYNFSDAELKSGSNYYRLKQMDNDGRFTYSSVIKIDYSKFAWSILGNPVANNSWVQLQLDKSANISVQIISINGNIIQRINKGNLSAGSYSIPLNLNNKNSGMYVVRLMVDNQAYSKKIIK